MNSTAPSEQAKQDDLKRIAHAKACALREFAEAHRMPWAMFHRSDDSPVTVGDLLRETADRIEAEADPVDEAQVGALADLLIDETPLLVLDAGKIARVLVKRGVRVEDGDDRG
jgi:hypothetical protein